MRGNEEARRVCTYLPVCLLHLNGYLLSSNDSGLLLRDRSTSFSRVAVSFTPLLKHQKANISDSNSWRGSAKLYTILNTENDGFVLYGLINRLSFSDQHQSSYPTWIVFWKLPPKFIFHICYKVGQSILTRQMGRTFQHSQAYVGLTGYPNCLFPRGNCLFNRSFRKLSWINPFPFTTILAEWATETDSNWIFKELFVTTSFNRFLAGDSCEILNCLSSVARQI